MVMLSHGMHERRRVCTICAGGGVGVGVLTWVYRCVSGICGMCVCLCVRVI